MIFVSAGHHAAARGAEYGGVSEFPETLEWAQMLMLELSEASPLSVPITPMLVPSGPLPGKIAFVNAHAQAGDLAIEIHFNASVPAHGSETLYCPGSVRGQALAECVQAQLASWFPPSRGVKEGWYQMNPAKGPDAFLSQTRPVAIIVEPEFMTNFGSIQMGRRQGVRAIARGLREYLARA